MKIKWILSLLLPLLVQQAHAEISDAELRRLFIVTGHETGQYKYGGVVMFKAFFDKNKSACAYKKANPNTTIFIDQEGGYVIRIPSAAPPSATSARDMSTEDFYKAVKKSAKKLKEACIDVNLAPVVEISQDPSRTYGSLPEEAIPKAKAFSEAMQSEGIRTVLKHFPGWNQNCVSVKELNSIKLKIRPNTEVESCSVPENSKYQFEQKMKVFTKVPSNAWMIGNNVIPELSPYPSTMNPNINDITRNVLGYKGLLISDALWEIEASPKAVLMALKVVDWVMIGYPQQAEAAIPYIKDAINKGFFTEQEIKDKLNRIDKFKS